MKIVVLLGLLAVQVIIVGVVFAVAFQEPEEPGLFLEFDPDDVDAMTIVSSEDTVNLILDDNSWELDNGMPADNEKVKELVKRMSELKSGWPVATSQASAERFEVTEESFQKHITLQSKDETVAEFYLGTSPGYQRVHARTDGPVHSVKLSNYEFGAKKSAWLFKQLLRPVGRVSRIERVGEFVLTKADEGWTASVEGNLDMSSVDSFAQRFTNLSVYDISEAELPELPEVSYVLLDQSGEMNLDLYFLEEDDDWVMTSSREEGKFELSTYIAEDMTKDFADLLVEEESSETDGEELGSIDSN